MWKILKADDLLLVACTEIPIQSFNFTQNPHYFASWNKDAHIAVLSANSIAQQMVFILSVAFR